MHTFIYYSHYISLLMLLVTSIAAGIIFVNNRKIENAFIFFAFVIYSFALAMNIFFGFSATFNEEGNMLSETEGLLSLNQTTVIQFIADLLLAAGFGVKAYAMAKQTTR